GTRGCAPSIHRPSVQPADCGRAPCMAPVVGAPIIRASLPRPAMPRKPAARPHLGSSTAAGARMIPLSILDLAPVCEGSDVATSSAHTLAPAGPAELLGYRRYWLPEHHIRPGIARPAPSVLIGHVAAGT